MHFKKLGVLNQDPPLPTTMGKWRCLFPQSKPIEWLKGNVIGSGSFGTVHMAINTATGSLFVVKSAKSKAGIASLYNEADLLHNLDSPHIIKCMGEDSKAANGETKYSLFFEYMSGGSISDVAQKFGGALNEKLIRLYTREILQGLKFLHQNRIVHCDVKCKNILLSASGAVKIADFGCAKRLISSDCKASLKGMGGTPLWMAPEVVRNEELSVAADIWSLGCTVIEMATGRPPWGGDALNPMAALLKIANGDEVPEFPGHFSPEGRDFLAKCLERDPRKRWTSEELLGHPFVAYNSIKEDTLSPTSVLDVASYDSDVSDEDDDDDDDDDNRVPFLLKCCWEEKNGSDNVLETSGSWITVRSR